MSLAELGAALLSAKWAFQIVWTLVIPIALLAYKLPHRPTSLARGVACVAALLVGCVGPVAAGVVTGLDSQQSMVAFTILLVVFVAMIMWVFDASVWAALFCATAGYTMQNLASGLEITAAIVISHRCTGTLDEPLASIFAICIPLAVYGLGYLLLIRRIDSNSLAIGREPIMLAMFLAVIFMIIYFDIVIKMLVWQSIRYNDLVTLREVHAVLCAFVLFAEYEILFAHRMRAEKNETERILAERDRQYRLSRENIEAINIKCHDIRHQIRHLAEGTAVVDKDALASIAHEVNVYDSVVETGNEALDTILTEKNLACSNENIVLSCIADGAALSFMAPSDIYSLFGNALDNAIEATRKVGDPDRRSITLNVARRGGMVAINVENYYAVAPVFDGELPRTSKGDTINHGFGMRSMECIVHRNGGSLHVGAKDGVFYLNALLAIPE